MADMVNHPRHYTDTPFGIEVIEVIEITRHYDFDLGNALKYILRAGRKNLDGTNRSMMPIDAAAAKVQDLKKAVWYIQDEIGMIRRRFEGIDLDDPWAPQKDEGPAFDPLWCFICLRGHVDGQEYDHEPLNTESEKSSEPIAVIIDGVVVSTTNEPAQPAESFDLDREMDAINEFRRANPIISALVDEFARSMPWHSDDELAAAIEAEFKKS